MRVKERTKELEDALEDIKKISITDKLTKLFNRNKLDEPLILESKRSNRLSTQFGVILIDIDYFKKVNDVYGHHAGDIFLMEFANILKENTREIDTVGRWGGEEKSS